MTEMNFRSFLRNLVLLSLVLIAVYYLLSFVLPENFLVTAFPFLVLFFLAVTLFIHWFLLKALRKSFAGFINRFMLATLLKLLIYFGVLVVRLLLSRENATAFILVYFALYLIYTGFEVLAIFRHTKQPGQS